MILCVPTGALGQEVRNEQDQSTIRANVNLVSIPVDVRNSKGELVLGLNEKDFRVFDNGVEQTVDTFEMSEAPISMVIVVETSSRVEMLLRALRRTGILFTQQVLRESGEAAVIGYDDGVIKLLDFTNDGDTIEKTFADLRPGNSGARLYDAMSEAVDMIRNVAPTRRRVIITLAEAFDNGSENNLSQVLHEAQVAHIMIYSVGLSTMAAEVLSPPRQAAAPRVTPFGTYGLPAPTMPGSANTPVQEQLRSGNMDLGGLVRPLWAFAVRKPPIEAVAAATGGLYQSTGDRGISVETAIGQISRELSGQYTLSYLRTGSDALGEHKIRVEVVGQRGLKPHYSAHYYLSSPN